MTGETVPAAQSAAAQPERHDWKGTILAGLANYIDAGSIVACSAALALWVEAYSLDIGLVGLIGALGANAVSAGVGALVGGRLCDRFGRKRIYQYDMLFYAFGMAWLVFATAPWMIIVGSVLVGLAVGADIPASWSLIAEGAPRGARARHGGVAQLLWALGPVVVLVLFFVLAPLGLFGARLVFAHLAVCALALAFMRRRMRESEIWNAARQERARTKPKFTAGHVRAMLFLIGVYGFWNLWAGTNGFFFPYILRTVGDQSQATSVALQASAFAIGMASTWLIFMRFADKLDQRWMFVAATVLQVVGMALLALFPLTLPVAIVHIVLMSIGAGFGAQPFFQIWSAELFPTLLRGTAQGVTFAVVRIGLGAWSLAVPFLTATGFTTLAWILTSFLVISGAIGFFWAPRGERRTLDQIE